MSWPPPPAAARPPTGRPSPTTATTGGGRGTAFAGGGGGRPPETAPRRGLPPPGRDHRKRRQLREDAARSCLRRGRYAATARRQHQARQCELARDARRRRRCRCRPRHRPRSIPPSRIVGIDGRRRRPTRRRVWECDRRIEIAGQPVRSSGFPDSAPTPSPPTATVAPATTIRRGQDALLLLLLQQLLGRWRRRRQWRLPEQTATAAECRLETRTSKFLG